MRRILGDDHDIATHFAPRYRPWNQRLAYEPDGDLFHAVARGGASVVTGEIGRFTGTGIRLAPGEGLAAELVGAATGFQLNVLGDIAFSVDGAPLAFHATVTYRGAMFTGLRNMVWVFGCFRAACTLRADLAGDFVCRLPAEMDRRGARRVAVALRPEDHNMPLLPWIAPENFSPGSLTRGLHPLPRRGDKPEWQHNQEYRAEKDACSAIDLHDAAFVLA